MVKVGLIGAGKMGISHLSILGAHPDVEIVGVCDSSSLILETLQKYTPFKCFYDFRKMVNTVELDAVFVAVPTKMHSAIIEELLHRGIHVFTEKPFCLTPKDGIPLIKLANEKKIVNQVGYHNRFIGTFNEAKRIIETNCLGTLVHFTGEAYGPVVLKQCKSTWRSSASEGGGCLMDYASHVLDLIHYLLSPTKKVHGTLLKSIYSQEVDDAIYSLLELENNLSGVISVNWSDNTYRKMSTTITIQGSKGKLICDAHELKVNFSDNPLLGGYEKGWNIRNITELTPPVQFNLRGEEYSAQIDHFIQSVKKELPGEKSTFQSSWFTDLAIDLIKTSTKNYG